MWYVAASDRDAPGPAGWKRRYSDDELVASLVRMWGIGPAQRVDVWKLGAWREPPQPEDARPLSWAGFYEDVGPRRPAPGQGPFYLEAFWPWNSASKAYWERAQDAGCHLRLLVQRLGRLAPAPGGLALFELPAVQAAAKLAASAHDHATTGGLYAVSPVGY